MSRAVGWVSSPSDIVKSSIAKALRHSFSILRELGPTSFTIKDAASVREQQAEGGGGSSAKRVFKVTLGATHSCTCIPFRHEKALCKHICWMLLKKFRIPQQHPFAYQAGLVPREIDELLAGTHQKKEIQQSDQAARETIDVSGSEIRHHRQLESDDVCPICQEELLAVKLPVTWCRACSNAAHIRCMKIWAEHQDNMNRGDTQSIQCPYCRQEFAPKEQLRREFSNTWESKKSREAVHSGVACAECSVTPIKGRLYVAHRADVRLCGKCYRAGAKANFKFNFRERPGQSLKPAKRTLPRHQMALELQGREINDGDYERLLDLDREPSPDNPGVPDHILNLIPCHRVGANRRLLREGIQCRLCLQAYAPEQYVKKLAKCNHYFHRDCIDTWLQNHRECPVDGTPVRLRQKSPKKTEVDRYDIIENRHRSIRSQPTRSARSRLLARAEVRGRPSPDASFSDILVTRPVFAPNAEAEDDHVEAINPIPLINFRMRQMHF